MFFIKALVLLSAVFVLSGCSVFISPMMFLLIKEDSAPQLKPQDTEIIEEVKDIEIIKPMFEDCKIVFLKGYGLQYQDS